MIHNISMIYGISKKKKTVFGCSMICVFFASWNISRSNIYDIVYMKKHHEKYPVISSFSEGKKTNTWSWESEGCSPGGGGQQESGTQVSSCWFKVYKLTTEFDELHNLTSYFTQLFFFFLDIFVCCGLNLASLKSTALCPAGCACFFRRFLKQPTNPSL